MATTITFKGMEPIACNVVMASTRPVTSADDIIKTQERPVIDIYFPVNTSFDTMVAAYEDSDALSEISINSEVMVQEQSTRDATEEEFESIKAQQVETRANEIRANITADISTYRNNRDLINQQLIQASNNTTAIENQLNTAKRIVDDADKAVESAQENLREVSLEASMAKSDLDVKQTMYDVWLADEAVDHETDEAKAEDENYKAEIATLQEAYNAVIVRQEEATTALNDARSAAATARVDADIDAKQQAYDVAKAEETRLTAEKADADAKYNKAVEELENAETTAEELVGIELSENPPKITEVVDRIEHQIFVHVNYQIKLGLQLKTVDSEEQWVMTLGQLSEADIALRQLAGVVAKKVNFLTFPEYQAALIEQSKKDLATYLETHPLISNCYHNAWNKFNATESHRNLFVSHFFAHTIKVQAGMKDDMMSWNISGQECVPWTDEEAALYTIAMDAYVTPLVHAQQRYELAIKAATTKEELDAIIIDYDAVNAPNGSVELLG